MRNKIDAKMIKTVNDKRSAQKENPYGDGDVIIDDLEVKTGRDISSGVNK